MHLHLGVKADALPEGIPPQWTIVNSWDVPIDAPGNVIVVSVRRAQYVASEQPPVRSKSVSVYVSM